MALSKNISYGTGPELSLWECYVSGTKCQSSKNHNRSCNRNYQKRQCSKLSNLSNQRDELERASANPNSVTWFLCAICNLGFAYWGEKASLSSGDLRSRGNAAAINWPRVHMWAVSWGSMARPGRAEEKVRSLKVQGVLNLFSLWHCGSSAFQ